MAGDDSKDRLERQYNRLSYSDQDEIKSSFRSFKKWLKTIEDLADLLAYAYSLYNWIKSRHRR
jgi:hypothetical protein